MKNTTKLQQTVINILNEHPERADADIARDAHTSGTYVGWIRRTYILHTDVKRRVVSFAKPGQRRAVVYERVLCLGPSNKPHYFMSPDRIKCRICPQCRETTERIRGGYDEPCRVVNRGA
jgi:hypothetical protein